MDDLKIPDEFTELAEFLDEQQKKLLVLIDEGPDEFSPEAIFML